MRIGAVVPAAGPGAAMLPFGGGTALEIILMRLAEAGVMGAIVVLRPDLTEAAAPLAQRRGARIVVNADPRADLLDSVRLGLAALTGDPDAIFIWPVEHPSVSSGTLRVLAHEAARGRALLPVFRGRRGYPLLLGAGLLGDVASLGAAQDFAALWQRRPEVVGEMEVQDAGVLREMESDDEGRQGS
jgi:molybdenum cofactor cytidylyltransferase